MSHTVKTVLTLVLAASASACASATAPGPDSYQAQVDRLSDQCKAQGGFLTNLRTPTGRPELDYACQIPNASGIRRN